MIGDVAARRTAEYGAVAAQEERFTHDLILDLLAYATGVPLPLAQIHAVVNAKRPQEPAAVLTLLQAFPWFVPNGPAEHANTGWVLDSDLHRRALQALAEGGISAVAKLMAPVPRPVVAAAPAPQPAAQPVDNPSPPRQCPRPVPDGSRWPRPPPRRPPRQPRCGSTVQSCWPCAPTI